MHYDVCIVSAEADFCRLLCYELEDRGLRVACVDSQQAAAEVSADSYLVDADRFSFVPGAGRVICYGRTLPDAPPPHEQWHRPFSLSLLGSLLHGGAQRGLVLQSGEQAVLLDGERIALTDREYACLQCLLAADGAPVSREELHRVVWQGEQDIGVVTVYLHYLRKKLERHGKRLIYAIRGRGYALRQGDEP